MSTRRRSIRSIYRRADVVAGYDDKRFSNRGGRHIQATELSIVRNAFSATGSGCTALDIATGTGRFALLLDELGYEVTAVDYSEEMLNQLGTKAAGQGREIVSLRGDALRLPFADNAFNGVNCMRLIWHYDEWQDFVESAVRVGRGTIVFDLMNRRSLRRVVKPLSERVAHESLVNEADVDAYLATMGHQVVHKEQGFAVPFIVYLKLPFLTPLLAPLDKILCRLGFGTMLYYVLAGTSEEVRETK